MLAITYAHPLVNMMLLEIYHSNNPD